jgi:hypothetical protein
MAYLMKDGFGQIELNQVAFRRDGRIEAQCALDPVDFADDYAENGMILVVDKRNNTIRFPKAADLEAGSLAAFVVNYSTEHMYDERALGLKNFRLGKDDFYPRTGYPAVGERWTTNAVKFTATDESADYAAKVAELKASYDAGALYAIPSTEGYVEITDDPGDCPFVLEAVEWTTMPDGQPGIKFQVVRV